MYAAITALGASPFPLSRSAKIFTKGLYFSATIAGLHIALHSAARPLRESSGSGVDFLPFTIYVGRMTNISQTPFESQLNQDIKDVYKPLRETIIQVLKENDASELGQRFAVLRINGTNLKALLDRNYDSHEGVFRYGDFYIDLEREIVKNQKIEEFFQNDYGFSLLPDILKRKTKSSMELLFKCHLYISLKFLECSTRDANTIRHYHKILLSKRRSLITRDKWGDVDETPWLSTLANFVSEKFEINAIEAQYSIMAPILPHLESINQVSMGFQWAFLTLEELEDKESEQEVESDAIVTGLDFEEYLFKIATENFPNANIEKTPASGDQGADLIISSPTRKIVVQAKYYSSTVGNSAVQEVFSAKSYYHADECIVVSKNGYTASAKMLANRTGVILVTTEDFLEILKEIASDLV